MNKKIITGTIIGLLVLGGVGYFVFQNSSKTVKVTISDVEKKAIQRTVSAAGSVHSEYEADLSFVVPGNLYNLSVSRGDNVKKGQPLASLNSYANFQNVEASRFALESARKDREIYIKTYEDSKDAVGGKEIYNLTIKQLDDAVNRANATYQALLTGLSDFYIRSPFDASVIDTFYENGETVLSGQTVVKVADLQNLIFVARLDQEDFGQVREGMQATITLDSYPGVQYKGSVLELPVYSNAVTNDFEVKIKLEQTDNKEYPILLGMQGDVSIIVAGTESDVPTLSFDAIFTENNKTYVWTDQNGKLKKKFIETGLEGDILTEIKTDLSNVKVVVPLSEENLTEGAPIKYNE